MTRRRSHRSFALATAALASCVACSLGWAAGCSGAEIETPSTEAGIDRGPISVPAPVLDGGVVCPPADVPGNLPPPNPPAPFYGRACDETMVSTLVDCTFNPSKVKEKRCADIPAPNVEPDAAISAYAAALIACRKCLVTSRSATFRGPILLDGDYAELNVGGCLINAFGDDKRSCAAAWATQEECAAVACNHCLAMGVPAHDECTTAARLGECKKYLSDADRRCVDAKLEIGRPGAICNARFNFVGSAIEYGLLFCGPPPTAPDAGPDADADASD